MSKDRASFEAWVLTKAEESGYRHMGSLLKCDEAGNYATTWVDSAWMGFQAAQRQPDWIACSERLPTETDADLYGNVWAYNKKKGYVQLATWYSVKTYAETVYTHWKPTGLKRPEPPEDV